jgi:hypothetical protein
MAVEPKDPCTRINSGFFLLCRIPSVHGSDETISVMLMATNSISENTCLGAA